MNRSASSILWLLAPLAALCFAGCVERKITIASDPPGALVWVNDVEKGRTPVTFDFLWYGDYDIRLRLDREEGTPPKLVQYYLHTHREAKAPLYQWIGPDLLAEISPWQFKDEKIWAFVIPPVTQESDEALIGRAKELQKQLSTPTTLERPVNKASK